MSHQLLINTSLNGQHYKMANYIIINDYYLLTVDKTYQWDYE